MVVAAWAAAAAAALRISRAVAAAAQAVRARAVAAAGRQRKRSARQFDAQLWSARPQRMAARGARPLVRAGAVCGCLGLAFLSCALIDGSGSAPNPARARFAAACRWLETAEDTAEERRKLACLDTLGLRLPKLDNAKLSLLKNHSQQKQEALLSS